MDLTGGVMPPEADVLAEALFRSIPVGMALFDPSMCFVLVNPALAEINGIPAEEHVGRPLTDLGIALPSEMADDIRRVFETGQSIPPREVAARDPGLAGRKRHWIVSYHPVTKAAGILWVGVTLIEVTSWRLAEAERVRLLEAEREARQAAEQAADRLARLQVLTGRLAEASNLEAIAEIVVTYGSQGVAATAAGLCILEGDQLVVVASNGMDERAVERFRRMPLCHELPAADSVLRRDLVLLGSVEERDRRYPAMAGVIARNRSFASVPLLFEGKAIGCLLFGWAQERQFDDTDHGFLIAMGRQAAQAVERSRLYEAERRARAAAVEASERMAFLAEASRMLSSSLDYEATLAGLAGLAIPAVADACAVHLLEDNHLRLVVVAHVDASRQPDMAALSSRSGDRGGPLRLGRVAATGEPRLFSEIPDQLWREMAEDEAHLAALRELGIESVLVVPLKVQDRVLGVLSLAMVSSDRRYTETDVSFVEDLAGRAAVAIDNARSHAAWTEVAQTLQRSLLPPHLPDIPGIDLAQRYRSVGDVEVGGDFFDVFPAGEGRWGVVMGDVCGKGVAAASLTALARYTVRAAAVDEGQPERVLRLLNRAVLDSEPGERFCTIVQAMVEKVGEWARVTLACGGHPLPLLVTGNGDVTAVGNPGTALGLFEEIELTEVGVDLHPGDALVFYTDGFTEVRSPEGRFNPRLLAEAVRSAAGESAEVMAEAVERAVLAFEGGRSRDDMALLILKVPSGS